MTKSDCTENCVHDNRKYLQSHIGDEKLRTLLTSQWGDYGSPAAQSAFAVHALIVSHYLNGGYYPHGGAVHIARVVEEIVERHGGGFLINNEVTESHRPGRRFS